MKTLRFAAFLAAVATMATLSMPSTSAHAAATIIINNVDGVGEGFNDPTVVAPVGGNPGVTLGAQRLFAFQYAANLIGQCINSNVTIVVNAKMDPQFCNATSAVLGSAGATTVHRDFVGAPLALTWYPQALANALAGVDLSPAQPDLVSTFNSNLNGNPACLGGWSWYYGVNATLPAMTIDFVSVVLHEILHGLGVQTFIGSTGALFSGFNDTYERRMHHVGAVPADYPSMTNAQRGACNLGDPNLVFNGPCVNLTHPTIPVTAGLSGGMVRLHGPNPFQGGSSLSHFSPAVTPNELMEPSYTGPNHSPGLALQLLKDIGWTLDPKLPVAVAITSFEATPVARGVELRAEFVSSFDLVNVNVYRAHDNGNWKMLESVTSDGAGDFAHLDAGAVPGERYTYRIGVVDGDGEFFSVERRVDMPVPAAELAQNVPNPFNPSTTIRFVLPAQQNVKLHVYDAGGRLVRTLADGVYTHGTHSLEWNGIDNSGTAVASGVYFYRLEAGTFAQTRKMVLLK